MIVDFDEALRVVLDQAAGVYGRGLEQVGLLESVGRVLAAEVRADRDQPGFARSTRDGYAVRAGEFASGAWLGVAGMVKAGELWGRRLDEGESVQIMTGAPLPEGADAVAMVEFVERVGDGVRGIAGRTLAQGENVVARGAEAWAEEVVLEVGTSVGAAEVALAASCGRAEVGVFARPTAAIVATGDELVEVGSGMPEEQQIWNSNGPGLAALVAGAGGEARRLAVARDTRADVAARIEEGLESDLLLLSGGVSMGEYDLVEEVLEEMGAEFFFTGVRMQPGKPVVFGRVGERLFFGLPGNPISTQVTFHCFVAPLLRAMGGAAVEEPRFAQAVLGEDVPGRPGLMRVLPARVAWDRVRPEVRLVRWQGSGDLAANGRANCYAVLPPEREGFHAGEAVSILLR